MNDLKYTHVVRCWVILALLVWPCLAKSDSTPSESQSRQVGATPGVEHEGPFAATPKQNNASVQKQGQPARPAGESPPLSLELITLKFLDAKDIGAAFAAMCTEYGGISILEKSNSLAIFDTKQNLEKIVAEVAKIDKPVPGLAVRAITLKSLDGKTAKAAIEKILSPNGNITIGEKGSSLIVCDTKKNLEAIVAEIAEIDKPMPGLVVEPMTLKFVDARSAQAALAKMSSEYGSIATIERTNSLIICDTRKNVDMIRAEIEKIDRPTSGLLVKTVTLKFLDAKGLKAVLDKMVSQYGSIATNEKNNSLIICDTRENLARMLAEIEKADKTPQQVMVEVVILDVQLKDDREIGINWDMLSSERQDVGYRQNFTTKRLVSTIEDVDTIGDATAFNSVGLGGDFSVITGTVRSVIHMLQQKRDVEILASPRAMMLSGQSANIKAVEEIPYTEVTDTAAGGVGALTSTKFKEVGVNLQVTATITDGNDIFLTVSAEQNAKTSVSTKGVPVVDTRKANTSLLLRDGQIVIMGGLRREEKVKEVDKIPFLGDLPIVGELFKRTNTVTNNSELIVMLSPHIYGRGTPIPQEAMAKYNRIKNKPLLTVPGNKH